MFSRVVRWPVRRRRATASGRAASSVIGVALVDQRDVGADRRRGRSPRRRWPRGRRRRPASTNTQRVALEDGVADGHADEAHEAGLGGGDDVLHLHRLHDEELLAGGRPDRRRRRRAARPSPAAVTRTAAVPAGPSSSSDDGRRRRAGAVPSRRRTARSPEVEHGQRIDGVDLGPGQPRATAAGGGRRRRPALLVGGGRRRARRRGRRRSAVVDLAGDDGRGGAGSLCRKPALVGTPSMRSSRERPAGLGQRVGEPARRRVHDDLGEQRVEAGAGAVAGVAERVGAVAGAGGHLERREHAAGRAGRCRRRPSSPC